ncbi:hypothetical protein JK636_12290 [Clostridium sp. YIM B02515]|uniref:Bacteriophage peptidoglycan hydrolase n=1 Tax=Clostridium rhizosphaerae TaxID=2803861 RepID=A0ABS1TBR2_9CLOT|nr:hypothetical protein [Clostridium rhizosphaerae]MBL4936537.1 hypothetical protein [Clostridium rhizosphaerae]
MKRVKFIIELIIIIVLCVVIVNKAREEFGTSNLQVRESIYKYLKSEKNQMQIYEAAMKLNNGSSQNTCVYFISEVLRNNKFQIPKETCNTGQMIALLEKEGWEKDNNYKNLKPGDICFTTDDKGNKNGVPSHTYVFMGWVKEGNYDYAYICDNQAKDYGNKVYHVRNISITANANGYKKDAFSFFMKDA